MRPALPEKPDRTALLRGPLFVSGDEFSVHPLARAQAFRQHITKTY